MEKKTYYCNECGNGEEGEGCVFTIIGCDEIGPSMCPVTDYGVEAQWLENHPDKESIAHNKRGDAK